MHQRKLKSSSDENKAAAPAAPATPTPAPQSRWHTWWVRTAATFVMIALFFALIYGGHIVCVLAIAGIEALVFQEVIALAHEHAIAKQVPAISQVINWYLFFLALYFLLGRAFIFQFEEELMINYLSEFLVRHHNIICFSGYLIAFIAFVLSLETGKYKAQFAQFGWSHIIITAVMVQANLWIYNIFMGLIWLFLPSSLVICNDIFAFVFGFFFGRTPLIKLSPKKTWEGFIGGLVATVVWAVIIAGILAEYEWMTCPKTDLHSWGVSCEPLFIFQKRYYELPLALISILQKVGIKQVAISLYPIQIHAFIMALFSSLVAPYGGFFASGFKRAFNKKDFDEKIPGHGGVTDRMDCQFLMGTFSYLYITTWVLSTDTVGSLFSKLMMLGTDEQLTFYHKLQQFLTEKGAL